MDSTDNAQGNPDNSYRGQYHAHPYGEFNMVVPLTPGAALAGPAGWREAGWTARAPGSHLAAKARGLDTCGQVSFARFHSVIASHLRLPAEDVTACGMEMGFGETNAEVNRVRMPRRSVAEFASLHGFEDLPEGVTA